MIKDGVTKSWLRVMFRHRSILQGGGELRMGANRQRRAAKGWKRFNKWLNVNTTHKAG